MTEDLNELPRSPGGRRFGLITFLDVLGFGSFSRNSKIEKVNEVLDEISAARDWSHYAQFGFNAYREVIQFQDSVVRCTETGWFQVPVVEDKLHLLELFDKSLGDELASLRDMQIGLIRKDILVRGAIVYGEFEVARGVVYGPAYDRAAFLEHTEAVFPRIILDKELLEQAPNLSPIGREVFDQHISQDDDRHFYVDYLEALAREIPWEIDTFLEMLEQHTFALDSAIKSGTANDRVRAKINWLCGYHNRTIVKCSRHLTRAHQVDWDSFKVDPEAGWVDEYPNLST